MKNLFISIATISTVILPIFFKNYPTNYVSPSPDSIDYSRVSEAEVQAYYSSLEEGLKGDELLDSLQNILKEGQIKVDYDTGYIEGESSKAWYGYSLYERDYTLSPVTEKEITSGKFKTSDIWINVLYLDSPIYIESSFNGGNYKYYPN